MNLFNKAGLFGIGAVSGIVLCIAILIFTQRNTINHILVSVENNSDYDISEIRIEYKNGFTVHNGLAKNSYITLPVFMDEKGAYSIKVRLENNDIVEGGVNRIVPGYSSKELVFNDRVETQHITVF